MTTVVAPNARPLRRWILDTCIITAWSDGSLTCWVRHGR